MLSQFRRRFGSPAATDGSPRSTWLVFIIGTIVILVVAFFVSPLIIKHASEERINLASALRIFKDQGIDEKKAREYLEQIDKDNDGFITLDEWEEVKADFQDRWIKENWPASRP